MAQTTGLNREIWKQTFERLQRRWSHLNPESITGRVSRAWNLFDQERKNFYALGIFSLQNGRLLLVRSWYDQEYDEIKDQMLGNITDFNFRVSRSENTGEALLEFLPELSQEEKTALNIFLLLRNNPAFQG